MENGVECYSCYSWKRTIPPHGEASEGVVITGGAKIGECVLSGGSLDDDFLRPHGVSAESENIDTGSGKLGMMHHECRVVDVETKQLAAHDVYDLQLAGAVDDKVVTIAVGERMVDDSGYGILAPYMSDKGDAVVQVVGDECGILTVYTLGEVAFETEEDHVEELCRCGFQLKGRRVEAVGCGADFKKVGRGDAEGAENIVANDACGFGFGRTLSERILETAKTVGGEREMAVGVDILVEDDMVDGVGAFALHAE